MAGFGLLFVFPLFRSCARTYPRLRYSGLLSPNPCEPLTEFTTSFSNPFAAKSASARSDFFLLNCNSSSAISLRKSKGTLVAASN